MRDKDSPGNDEKVIRGILQYLVEHPDANDTCEGILKWWRPKDISEWGKEDVQKALDFLTSKGWLTERKTTRLKKKGDLAYTTTLLPGEKVRLFSTDRRSRFTFDKETKVSYRHAQASEDQFYMASMGREMSDLTITKQGESSSHSWGDWGADMDSQYVSIGFAGAGGGSIDGHYDDQSTTPRARISDPRLRRALRLPYRLEKFPRGRTSKVNPKITSNRHHACFGIRTGATR